MSLSPTKSAPLDRRRARLGYFDFALALSKRTPSHQLEHIKSLFNRHGFRYELVEKKDLANSFLFLAYDNIIGILKQAEKLHIPKKRYNTFQKEDSLSTSRLKSLLREKSLKTLDPVIAELEQTSLFSYSRRKEFIPDSTNGSSEFNGTDFEVFDNYIDIFTQSELTRIICTLIQSIEIDTHDPEVVRIFNVKETSESHFKSHRLLDFLIRHEIVESISPLHTEDLVDSIKDPEKMTNYYGQNIAIYFSFMSFYIKWLAIPAAVGLVRQLLIFLDPDGVLLNFELDLLYGIVVIIWAVLFIKYWRRESNSICMKWGSVGTRFKASDTRFDFRGEIVINNVTELPEYQFSPKKRAVLYVKSYLTHLPLMLFSFFVMVVFLNMLGYVDSHHSIYIQFFSDLSVQGAIFDKNTSWSFIPTISQGLSMAILSAMNKKIANFTTKRENHRTNTSFNNSIIFKRFIFEIINTFTHLFYIAFWRLDENALSVELTALFATDEIRRLATEGLIPYVQKKFSGKTKPKEANPSREAYLEEKVEELKLAHYEAYDDYLEMVIQFGYITLFASAFPLSGALSLVFNIAERASDAAKLRYTHKRPIPTIVNGIGSWQSLINFMSHLCLVTNTILIAYSQSIKKAVGDRFFAGDECEQYKVLILVFFLEHIIFVVAYFIRKKIDNEPKWISIYRQRSLKRASSLL